MKIMLLYTIPIVPDVDKSTFMTTAQQKARNAITAMDWIIILHYVDVINKEKTALSGPLADPTLGNIAKADMVVIPPASTGSPAT